MRTQRLGNDYGDWSLRRATFFEDGEAVVVVGSGDYEFVGSVR